MTRHDSDSPRVRGDRGRYVRTVSDAERDAQAAELRSAGHTFQEIADQLGLSHRDLARRAVDRALAEIVRPAAEAVKTLELEKLDRLEEAAWRVLRREHVVVSHGRVIRDEAGQPLTDDAPVLSAAETILHTMKRRAALLGLDAPSRSAVTVQARDPEWDREIAELVGWIARQPSGWAPPWHPEATREDG